MNEKKDALYLECYSGISGDMVTAALLDLGADEAVLRKALASLPLDGFGIDIRRVKKAGLDACDFDVVLDAAHENHDHDMAYLYGGAGECHAHDHHHDHDEDAHAHHPHADEDEHCHEHHYDGEHEHGCHNHEAEHCHDHEHTHEHHHHEHRGLAEVLDILNKADLTDRARATAVRIFTILGRAEAKAHGATLETVHFHEVGAVDSIVDIVGAAACAVDLGITETYVSTIYEGQGHVWCQHGRIPVPAPAVAGIAAAEELDLAITNVSGEMVTPTGAAIAAAIRTKKGLPKTFVIRKIGMGAGKKDFPHANLLRAMIIEPVMNGLPAGNAVEEPTRSVNADGDSQKNGSSAQEKSSSDETEDEIWVLETNLDDCTGEMMGLTMELLLAAGARDVNYTPIYMKKNRPACKLEVLCKEEKVSALEEVIFHQTTAIGLRKRKEVRRILPRKKETVMTPYGEVELKICTSAGENYIYPEYDSIRGLVQETGRSYQEIYQKAVEEAWKKRKND